MPHHGLAPATSRTPPRNYAFARHCSWFVLSRVAATSPITTEAAIAQTHARGYTIVMAAAAVGGGGVEEAAQLDRLAAELFRRADRNGDLSLSHTEMKKLLKQAGVREQMHIAGGTSAQAGTRMGAPHCHKFSGRCAPRKTRSMRPRLGKTEPSWQAIQQLLPFAVLSP